MLDFGFWVLGRWLRKALRAACGDGLRFKFDSSGFWVYGSRMSVVRFTLAGLAFRSNHGLRFMGLFGLGCRCWARKFSRFRTFVSA